MSGPENKKRTLLPNFKKISREFDIDELQKAFHDCPQNFDDLLTGYKRISQAFPEDEAAFGLAFSSEEEANAYCSENGIVANIAKDGDGNRWRIGSSSLRYFQMAVTEYDGIGDPLLETSYSRLCSWARGTYFEEILKSFKGTVMRARVARMLPGCFVDKHIDYNTDFGVRFHIAINSGSNNWLTVFRRGVPDELHIPTDGSCWFVNQGWPHTATNLDPFPRDHLVVSVRGQADLGE